MESTSEIDPSTIAVSVDDGEVTLAGTLQDNREMRRLVDLLGHVRGVRRINNLTTVSPAAKHRDRAVSRAGKTMLAVHFPDQQVEVTIFGDVAVLEGRVSSNVVRSQIARMMETYGGVRQVVDKLKLRAEPPSRGGRRKRRRPTTAR
jgi:osmotically-inducible protein OsmY